MDKHKKENISNQNKNNHSNIKQQLSNNNNNNSTNNTHKDQDKIEKQYQRNITQITQGNINTHLH